MYVAFPQPTLAPFLFVSITSGSAARDSVKLEVRTVVTVSSLVDVDTLIAEDLHTKANKARVSERSATNQPFVEAFS